MDTKEINFCIIKKLIPNQPKEKYNGNREYKLFLSHKKYIKNSSGEFDLHLDDDLEKSDKVLQKDITIKKKENIQKLNKRATQLLFRLNEGCGKALYIIGIDDNGIVKGLSINKIKESYDFLLNMIQIINAELTSFNVYLAKNGYVATARIYMSNYEEFY
jgi:GTPase